MGIRLRLAPDQHQRQKLVQNADAARWTYNWGLEIRQKSWAYAQQSENAMSLHKLLVSLKARHYPWLYEVSKCAPQEALRDLDRAYQNWWRRLKEGKRGKAAGAPRFKSRQRNGIGGFRLTGHIRVEHAGGDAYIRLPRIGKVRLAENDRLPIGKLSQVTIRERADHWYVSAQIPVAVKAQYGQRVRNLNPVGVDLGLTALATLPDGTKFDSPKALRHSLRKLARLERQKSRRQLGSRNRAKTRVKLARAHERVVNQRSDCTHKLTTYLATTNTAIVIEDLNVQGMAKNHSLALGIMDAGWGTFRRQLEYKCDWYGCGLELAPRFYPSTQTCSACGLVKTGDEKIDLKERVFRCTGCSLVLDRDENAARVLAALYGSEITKKLVAASCVETQNACGARSTGSAHKRGVKLLAVKQEPNLVQTCSAEVGVTVN